MSEISDKLRKVADEWDVTPLYKLAAHMDAEMLCRPKAADGDFLYVGEKVRLDDEDEDEVYTVKDIRTVVVVTNKLWSESFRPEDLVHTKPDSLERIADELVEWCDRTDVDGDACGEPRELARRIRKLAKRDSNE